MVLAVFALLGAVLWLLRARGLASWRLPQRSSGPRRLRVVERIALTPQHSLHLVQFDGRTLVIGVSPAGCHLLTGEPGAGEGAR